MKILFLSPSAQLGGAEFSLLDVVACLREASPAWSLALLAGANGPLLERASELGINVIALPFPRLFARLGDANIAGAINTRGGHLTGLLAAAPQVASYVRRLRKVITELRPDLIHSNGMKMHLLAVWAREPTTPVIWHMRDYLSSRPLMARLLRSQADKCATVITNSESVTRDVRAVCSDKMAIRTIYNRIDLTRFSPATNADCKLDLDQLAGLPPAPAGVVRVGLISTLARWKGHDVFLRALSLLPDGLQLRGYVIGGAIYETKGSQHSLKQLKQKAAELGLKNRVGFTGSVSEPEKAIRALDVIVHASTQPEPFGRVIVEGMACGRAVIVSKAGGAAELINDGKNALSFTPGDAAMLAERLETLIRYPNLRSVLGQNGRRTAEERFDRSGLAAELIPVYQEVTGGRYL